MSAPVRADQTVDNKQLADKLFLEGRELLETKPAAACDKFLEALQHEKKNVAILLNLGLCHEKQGKHASALKWYRQTGQIANEKNDPALKEYQTAAEDRTKELAQKVSKVELQLGSLQSNAEILVNGQTVNKADLIVEVDQGTAIIEARAPGMLTSKTELPVPNNESSLTHKFEALKVAPPPPGSGSRRKLIGALIGGGIIAVTTTVSGFLAKGNKDDFDNPDFTGDRDALSQRNPNIIFFSGLAVGLGIAAYMWFTTPKTEKAPTTAVTPVVGGDQVGLSVFRRF